MRLLDRMTPKLLRILYAFEFLIALIAIFTAWSEIGGQAALDLMHWGWKFGLSLALAGSFVAYTAAVVSQASPWTLRSARWLSAMLLVLIAMGVVTYFYVLLDEASEPDDNGTISALESAAHAVELG